MSFKINAIKCLRTTLTKQASFRYYADVAKPTTVAATVSSATTTFPITPSEDKVKQPGSPSDPKLGLTKQEVDVLLNPKDLLLKVEPLELAPESEALRKSLSFDEVPGPSLLKHIAKFWTFIPVVGTQLTASTVQYLLSAGKIFGSQLTWGSNLWLFRWLLDEYGPVVRLHGPFGGDVVILSRPEHVGAVFQNEGRYPVRSSLDCVEKYRLQFRKFKQAGPFLMYGPEWEKLRKTLEQPMQQSVVQQFEKVDKICDEFITRVLRIRNRQDEVPDTFYKEIFKWNMECMCSVIINHRLAFLDPAGLSSTSEPARLLDGLNGATNAIQRCEYGLHLWKFVETPAWKSLVKNCDAIDSILNRYIQKAQETLREKQGTATVAKPDNVALVETLLLKDGMLPDDVLTVLLDMMLIGVNTSCHTVAFLFYHLSRSPRVQRLLYDEIKQAPEHLTSEKLSALPYLQACIKESLRLKPPMPILSRVLMKDILVHNYRIPKGTYMLIATHLSSLREEHFEDPAKYKPERWLNVDMHKDLHAFATIPFGHGAKGCLARELAEMQIGMLLVKVLSKFRIEYHYGDINSTNKMLSAPDRPLKFRLVDRN